MIFKQSFPNKKTKVSTRLFILISTIIIIVGISSIFLINWRMKSYAQKEAEEKAMILLDRNLATHTYFSNQLKPVLFKKIECNDAYFEPIWMSSTYAVREIDKYYRSLTKRDYYYKEAAINARSPENEADAFERTFIEKINESPDLNQHSGVRNINERPFFVVLRRGETMEQSCLRCHSAPEAAPTDMGAYYGPAHSFQRSVDEVVSAISIRIPLDAAYADVNRLIFHLSVLYGLTVLIIFGMATYFGKRWVFEPLSSIYIKAMEIYKNPEHLGEQIDLPSGLELFELTEGFNFMSSQLRKERDQLESRVIERTEELDNANMQLAKEVDKHKMTITELEASLKEIKTLRGILPICSFCKKIRDDKGYWEQVDVYIYKHSQADISHGICPECAKKHYPDMDLYDE